MERDTQRTSTCQSSFQRGRAAKRKVCFFIRLFFRPLLRCVLKMILFNLGWICHQYYINILKVSEGTNCRWLKALHKALLLYFINNTLHLIQRMHNMTNQRDIPNIFKETLHAGAHSTFILITVVPDFEK